MYQEVIASPGVFQKWGLLGNNDLARFFRAFITEVFLDDREHSLLAEYNRAIADLEQNSPASFMAQAFQAMVVSSGQMRSVRITTPHRNIGEWPQLGRELALARESGCKLVLGGEIDPLVLEQCLQNDRVEAATLVEYLDPPLDSRVRSSCSLTLRAGMAFHVDKWLLKYLHGANLVTIQDGYVAGWRAIIILERMLACLPRSTKIEIVTLSRAAIEASSQDRMKGNAIDPEKDLTRLVDKLGLANCSLEFVEKKSLLRDRVILTDRFKIVHGHAFDAVNPRTNIVERDAEIVVLTA